MLRRTIFVLHLLACATITGAASAQTTVQENNSPANLSVRSTLVLVPALVKTKSGELVHSLTAEDFVLTDDGVPQPLRLEDDADAQPLALVVVVQAGGLGRYHLREYSGLYPVLDALIGDVQHRIALVSFDSEPHLEQDFTDRTEKVTTAIGDLDEGDSGSAILDALTYGTSLLAKQPSTFRRALLLVSETVDAGSNTSFESAIRAVDDTNTSIYGFGYASTKGAMKHEASKLPRPYKQTPYSNESYPAGGCMSRGADPDANGNRAVQAVDCLSDLLPPLRLARLAFIAATEGIKRNVPESVAHLTGGEYFNFKDARTFNRELLTIANDIPNHYVLSFRPHSPHPGLHALDLRLKNRPEFDLKARSAYWIDAEPTTDPKP